MIKSDFGNFYEDFDVGQNISHALSKTIFESDNNLFSLLTMNHHPIHTNADYASRQQHQKILVVGTLVFSLAVGLTVPDISGKAIANLNYEEILHKGPVFIGDTIYAKTEVLEKRESNTKNDRGIIKVRTNVFNQENMIILIFTRSVLVKKREAA
ncbi:dehydratase [Malikia spinosa]|uniref:Dehydratase n=1 Tax=Malikia spinosa TaxID=86180 RepID=A0A2S9KDA4_9BURK|nr:MaoC family dehydratase [Malikia spinosa]PRD68382.1 dehydratase [Malikia spinosa]